MLTFMNFGTPYGPLYSLLGEHNLLWSSIFLFLLFIFYFFLLLFFLQSQEHSWFHFGAIVTNFCPNVWSVYSGCVTAKAGSTATKWEYRLPPSTVESGQLVLNYCQSLTQTISSSFLRTPQKLEKKLLFNFSLAHENWILSSLSLLSFEKGKENNSFSSRFMRFVKSFNLIGFMMTPKIIFFVLTAWGNFG